MDAQKVIEVADFHLRQYGHCLTDKVRAELRGSFGADGPPPTSHEVMLRLSIELGDSLRKDSVVAKFFPRERRLPGKEDAIAHCAAMNQQVPQLLAGGHLRECCLMFGFLAGVTNSLTFTNVMLYPMVSFCAEEAKRYVGEGKLLEAYCLLGHAQGLLWVMGIYSIDELTNHNKPYPAFVSE